MFELCDNTSNNISVVLALTLHALVCTSFSTMTKKRLEKVKKAKGEMGGGNDEQANNDKPADYLGDLPCICL